MALPFYDRVVQHAINNVLEPIFNKRFISHSYACRKDKGMHAGYTTGTSTIKTSHYTQSKRTYTTISRVSRMRYLRQKSEILSRTSKRLY